MIFDDLLTHYNVKNRTFINYEKSMKLVHIFKRRAPAFWCYVFLTQWGPERASQLKKGGVVQWLVLHFVDAMRLRFLMFVISICFFLFVCLPFVKKNHDLFFLAFSQFLRVRSGAISFNRVESNGFFFVLRRCGSQFLDNVLADVVGPASEPAQASQGSDNLAQMFGSNLNSMLICICLSCQHVACSFASWVCLSVFIWLHQLKCR